MTLYEKSLYESKIIKKIIDLEKTNVPEAKIIANSFLYKNKNRFAARRCFLDYYKLLYLAKNAKNQMIKIRNTYDKVIFEVDAKSFRDAIDVIVKKNDDMCGGFILKQANLQGADLSNAKLQRINLRGANLRGANLRGTDFYQAHLDSADLTGADLTGADLSCAILVDADLSNANFEGANLSKSNLAEANMREANLIDADLSGAIMTSTYIKGIKVSNETLESLGLKL